MYNKGHTVYVSDDVHVHYAMKCVNRGIKHDFPLINIRKVPRIVLKTEGVVFNLPEGPCKLMNDKIMFDRYYCINSAKHCENEENIGALYFITSSHVPTRVRFKKNMHDSGPIQLLKSCVGVSIFPCQNWHVKHCVKKI